jgi:peptidoglycan/LPS O-acetylase OafA/YrhL
VAATFGMLAFFGAFLADLSQHPPHQAWCTARKWPSCLLSPIFILFGLLLASYPEAEPQLMAWSRMMGEYSFYIFPLENDTPRFYTGVGLVFVSLGIHFSTLAKTILSSKYLLWFGKNSFAVYLIHGSLLRSVMVWMYFGIHTPADIIIESGGIEPGPPLKICGSVRFWFWMPIWLAIVYSLASLWTKYVDPWCARVTERLVKYVFEGPQLDLNPEKRLLPQ